MLLVFGEMYLPFLAGEPTFASKPMSSKRHRSQITGHCRQWFSNFPFFNNYYKIVTIKVN